MRYKSKFRFQDFTEQKYRQYLQKANRKFIFIRFEEERVAENTCLWRHDIDTSPHRALKLAQIENEEGVSATYFFLLHSNRYNFLEKEIVDIAKEIEKLGHFIGLHFDPGFYGAAIQNKKDLDEKIRFEKIILEEVLKNEISSFSFHNPSLLGFDYSQDILGGLVNAYSKRIQDKFEYISDSYCFWRFKTLEEVLEDQTIKNLQVLIHPVCWTPKVMSPFNRFKRAVNGRAEKTISDYISFAKKINRKVIK